MSAIMPFIVQGIGYGFIAGVTIGPFLGYVLTVVLTRGWRRSLPLVTVPVVVDAPIIFVFLNLLNRLPLYALDVMEITGGAFVLWLGWSTWRDTRREMRSRNGNTSTAHNAPAQRSMWGVYLRGLLVNALNPAPYLFWSTVSGPIVLDGFSSGGIAYGGAFLVAYYSVFLSLIVVLMLVVDRLGEVNERLEQYMLPVTIVLMVLLGGGLVGAGIMDLMG